MAPPMAEMSPTCSIMVAKAIGTIMTIEETSRPVSTLPEAKRPKTVSCALTGRPIQAASFTPEKSTWPKMAATT